MQSLAYNFWFTQL